MILSLKKILSLLTTFFCLSSLAQAQGWTDPLIVDRFIVEDNLIAVYTTGQPGSYVPGCVSGSYTIKMSTEEARNQAISILLTASTINKKVKFWYKDTCTTWNYQDISAVQFVPNQ